MANRFYAFLFLAIIVWFAVALLVPTTLNGAALVGLAAM